MHLFGISVFIRFGGESWCLPYAGFLDLDQENSWLENLHMFGRRCQSRVREQGESAVMQDRGAAGNMACWVQEGGGDCGGGVVGSS